MRARVSSRGNYVLEAAESTTAVSDDDIDPVLLAVMSNRIDAITREMTLIVLRSAASKLPTFCAPPMLLLAVLLAKNFLHFRHLTLK